jgi:predicted amidohydrolase YtcJ
MKKRRDRSNPGKFADMIVLDHDPLTADPEELLKTRVDLTVFRRKSCL